LSAINARAPAKVRLRCDLPYCGAEPRNATRGKFASQPGTQISLANLAMRSLQQSLGHAMSLLLLIVILVLLFGGGGGYWGYSRGYYGGRGHGLIWFVLVIIILVVLFGGGHYAQV
jgi:hypothetical protein